MIDKFLLFWFGCTRRFALTTVANAGLKFAAQLSLCLVEWEVDAP
jgi:hypothetical protein